MARPGRPPKGRRAQITLRVPIEHAEHYREEATREGLALMDYLARELAKAHELPEPAYLSRSRAQAELELDVVA